MNGLTLDAGALIAAERGSDYMLGLLADAHRRQTPVRIPGGVLAQIWRASPRQHDLVVLLAAKHVTIVPLDREQALAVGALCATTQTRDIVDASVVITATAYDDNIITSDPDDLERLGAQHVFTV